MLISAVMTVIFVMIRAVNELTAEGVGSATTILFWLVGALLAIAIVAIFIYKVVQHVDQQKWENSEDEAEQRAYEEAEAKRIKLSISSGTIEDRPFVALEWVEPITRSATQEFSIYRVEGLNSTYILLANTRGLVYKDFSVQTGKTYSYWVIRTSPLAHRDSLPSPVQSISI